MKTKTETYVEFYINIRYSSQVNKKTILGWQYRDTFVGDEAYRPKTVLGKMSNTIEKGRFTNWGEAAKLWHHVFDNELRVLSKECHVFMPASAATTNVFFLSLL